MEKPERNTADLLVECLIEEGVEYIFGIPGEENLALMNAIYAVSYTHLDVYKRQLLLCSAHLSDLRPYCFLTVSAAHLIYCSLHALRRP